MERLDRRPVSAIEVVEVLRLARKSTALSSNATPGAWCFTGLAILDGRCLVRLRARFLNLRCITKHPQGRNYSFLLIFTP